MEQSEDDAEDASQGTLKEEGLPKQSRGAATAFSPFVAVFLVVHILLFACPHFFGGAFLSPSEVQAFAGFASSLSGRGGQAPTAPISTNDSRQCPRLCQ